MSEKFNQQKYVNEYMKEKYDRCIFNVPKGDKKKIQEHFQKLGYTSLNAYVNELIRRDMNEENGKSNVNVGKIENQEGGTIQIG